MGVNEINTISYLEELKRVCESKEFQTKPRMKKFITYLTTELVEGRGNNIKGYSIGVDVFEQPDNFDPDLNALVRINAGRLRRLLRLYYLEEGVNNPIKIEIPKGKYIPNFTEQTNTKEPKLKDIGKQNDLNIHEKPSLAVLPFRNISKKQDLDFLCFGLSQELASISARFNDLRIIGSVNRPQQDILDQSVIYNYKELGFNYLIDGDVAAFGNAINVAIRLIDVNENHRIWGDNFKINMEKDDVFDVQSKISAEVAKKIGSEYGLINKKNTLLLLEGENVDLSDYMLMLKYYYYQTLLSEELWVELLNSVEKALTNRPNSAILWAMKANLYGDIYAFDMPGEEEAYKNLGEFAEKACSLNPDNIFVRVAVAFKCFMYGEKERFYNICDETISRIPNSSFRLSVFAMFLCLNGEWIQGKELLDRVFENNIDVPKWIYGTTCLYYYRNEEYELALKEANKYQVPGFHWGPLLRAATHGQLNQIEAAKNNIEHLLEIRPDFNEKGVSMITKYIKEDSLISHVLEGLEKGGLKISA